MSELELQVRYKETDRMGRVYHSNYFVWFDMARTEYLREKGCSYKELEDQGLFFVVADTGCKYLNSLSFDDKVLIKTKVTEKKKVSLRFEYEVYKKGDDEKIAVAWTILAGVNKEGRVVPIPEEILTSL